MEYREWGAERGKMFSSIEVFNQECSRVYKRMVIHDYKILILVKCTYGLIVICVRSDDENGETHTKVFSVCLLRRNLI